MSKIVNFVILAGAVLAGHLVLPATASAATLRASASNRTMNGGISRVINDRATRR